jgi:hypothetical protein
VGGLWVFCVLLLWVFGVPICGYLMSLFVGILCAYDIVFIHIHEEQQGVKSQKLVNMRYPNN